VAYAMSIAPCRQGINILILSILFSVCFSIKLSLFAKNGQNCQNNHHTTEKGRPQKKNRLENFGSFFVIENDQNSPIHRCTKLNNLSVKMSRFKIFTELGTSAVY
jgi:hypothetical protein